MLSIEKPELKIYSRDGNHQELTSDNTGTLGTLRGADPPC